MKKIITQEQIDVILQIVYATNISAQTNDTLKKFFKELPEVKTPTAVTEGDVPFDPKDLDNIKK